MDLKVGYVCDRGLNPKRPVNQDRLLALPERGLFAVFDGVGGQRAGEVASQTAADTIEEALTHTTTDGSSVEVIRRAIDFANRDIFEMAENDPAFKTMATTVALIHINGTGVTVAHVGDSRVYRLEEGHLFRETVDHTDLNDDIRAGRIIREQAAEPVRDNVINRALGVESGVEVEIKSIKVHDGARFLLCSDGVYRHLSDDEIGRVLAEHKDPQRAANELKRIVHQRGAEDNLTAVVVQMGRARNTPITTIDDGVSERSYGQTVGAGAKASRVPDPGGRIRVEFNRNASGRDRASRGDEGAGSERSIKRIDAKRGGSGSKILMYALLVLLIAGGGFYGGLRASEMIKKRMAGQPAASLDPLQSGRDAFERGEYRTAAAEFESLARRDPSNGKAMYWLGRAFLEQGDYQGAAKSFEEAIVKQPSIYDAYIQQAAAYEAMGERSKAALALSRYVEERRRQPVPAPQ